MKVSLTNKLFGANNVTLKAINYDKIRKKSKNCLFSVNYQMNYSLGISN